MRVLTLWEPWATLIAMGHKQIETRNWATSHRGDLLIHAAKTKKYCKHMQVLDLCRRAGMGRHAANEVFHAMRPGNVLAVVDVKSIVTTEEASAAKFFTQKEFAFGDYAPLRYAWRLERLERLPQPFAATGRQQIWYLNPEDVVKVTHWLPGRGA